MAEPNVVSTCVIPELQSGEQTDPGFRASFEASLDYLRSFLKIPPSKNKTNKSQPTKQTNTFFSRMEDPFQSGVNKTTSVGPNYFLFPAKGFSVCFLTLCISGLSIFFCSSLLETKTHLQLSSTNGLGPLGHRARCVGTVCETGCQLHKHILQT